LLRLRKRIDQLESLNLKEIVGYRDVEPIERDIEQTLRQVFESRGDYSRYKEAAQLLPLRRPISWLRSDIRTHLEIKGLPKSLSLLRQAAQRLEEDIAAAELTSAQDEVVTKAAVPRNSRAAVFVVHGHDEDCRKEVTQFLERLGFEAIVLNEQANRGRTVIEKIEAHSDVQFAVVLLTPDDVGGKATAELNPRARQNVILELGYFIARLGRDKVCALKSGDLELPSDILGVVCVDLDDRKVWQGKFATELEGAGYEIDWKKMVAR
jgi:predicted nucleotide-binding protein